MFHHNKHCFKIETRNYNNSMFEASVDATYIIHLENNGRLPSINKQLEHFKPTNIVHIVFNQGFKKCNKDLGEQTPPYDLADTFIYILQDANEKNYNNILILEDDFIFSKEIYKNDHLKNINNFVSKNKNEKLLYYLGCLSFLQIPYNIHTNLLLSSIGTHSIIYSAAARNILLTTVYNKNNIFDWDTYLNLCPGLKRFVYKKPLCFQLFTDTENSKHWNSWIPFKSYFSDPIKIFIKYYRLDIQPEPGYSNTYLLAKILGYLIIIFMIVLIAMLLFFSWLFIKKYNIFKKLYKSKS